MTARLQPNLAQRMPTREEIMARAYELYLARGCQHGHDLDDWLQAEYELRRVPLRVLAEMSPPPNKGKRPSKSLVDVIRAAMY